MFLLSASFAVSIFFVRSPGWISAGTLAIVNLLALLGRPDAAPFIAGAQGFTFPYVFDETQAVAKAYGAVCTPDFFGFNAEHELQYRGRLDASGMDTAPADARRELFEAMSRVAETGHGPAEQTASIGCSIKWRE